MIIFLSSILVISYITFGFIIYNLLRKTEIMEKMIYDRDNMLIAINERITVAIASMRAIDLRGAFEATDEVGGVFKTMLAIVDSLNAFFTEEDDDNKNT
jgi:hypothetical protein